MGVQSFIERMITLIIKIQLSFWVFLKPLLALTAFMQSENTIIYYIIHEVLFTLKMYACSFISSNVRRPFISYHRSVSSLTFFFVFLVNNQLCYM